MKIVSQNKKARHNYEILDTYTAGIALEGWEVKTARVNAIDISNSYCSIYKGEIWWKDSFFNSYMLQKNDEYRDRKLLMNKKEILKIKNICEAKNTTIVPLKLFFNNKNYLKLEIGIAKGLKKYDKRDKIIKEENQKYLKKYII
ncbi:SsrA-binding protein [Mycoplasma hafezii]|uniref:SsrA-binding protein n=1 Tax=Mycoplasma hafezii TaxID=525886 RepID=UPI003CED835F